MRKRDYTGLIWITLLVLLFILIVSGRAEAEDTHSLYKRLSRGTVFIYNHAHNASCAGVYIQTVLIATAAHCVEGLQEVAVVDPTGAVYATIVIARKDDDDLAVLRRKDGTGPPFRTSDKIPKIGTHIYCVGHPLRTKFSMTDGIIMSTLSPFGIQTAPGVAAQRKLLLTTAPTLPGFSGGGCFTEDGTLVGIGSASMNGHLFAIVTAKNLCKFANCKEKKK